MIKRLLNIFRVEKDDLGRVLITSTVPNKHPDLEDNSFNTVILNKEDALDLIGELYNIIEEIEKEPRQLLKSMKNKKNYFNNNE